MARRRARSLVPLRQHVNTGVTLARPGQLIVPRHGPKGSDGGEVPLGPLFLFDHSVTVTGGGPTTCAITYVADQSVDLAANNVATPVIETREWYDKAEVVPVISPDWLWMEWTKISGDDPDIGTLGNVNLLGGSDEQWGYIVGAGSTKLGSFLVTVYTGALADEPVETCLIDLEGTRT